MAEILQFTQPRRPVPRRRGPATILPFIGVRYERVEIAAATEANAATSLPLERTGPLPEL